MVVSSRIQQNSPHRRLFTPVQKALLVLYRNRKIKILCIKLGIFPPDSCKSTAFRVNFLQNRDFEGTLCKAGEAFIAAEKTQYKGFP
jgi:hypothetical protein